MSRPGGQRASRLVGVHLTKRCGTATIGRCRALFPMALPRRCRAPWSSTWRQPLCSLPPAAMPTRGPSPLFRRFRRFRRMPTRGLSPLAPTIPSRPKPRLCGHGNRRAGDLGCGRPTPHSHTLPTYSPQTHTPHSHTLPTSPHRLPSATHSPRLPVAVLALCALLALHRVTRLGIPPLGVPPLGTALFAAATGADSVSPMPMPMPVCRWVGLRCTDTNGRSGQCELRTHLLSTSAASWLACAPREGHVAISNARCASAWRTVRQPLHASPLRSSLFMPLLAIGSCTS